MPYGTGVKAAVRRTALSAELSVQGTAAMPSRRRSLAGLLAVAGALLGGCSGTSSYFSSFPSLSSSPAPASTDAGAGTTLGTGQVKVGLILPLSAAGNAGVAGQSMNNAAEMALAEFNIPNIQLLVKDDGGSPQGAQQGTQQALDEGAEIILGPLFALSVSAVGQLARARNVPVIAFSTDSNVAATRRLSAELPAGIRRRAASSNIPPRSGSARSPRWCPTTPMARWSKPRSSRRWRAAAAGSSRSSITRTTRPPWPRRSRPWRSAAARADALFIPDGGDAVPDVVRGAGRGRRQPQEHPACSAPGLWDNPRVFATPALEGGLYAAPDSAGFRSFAGRYRARYNAGPGAHRDAGL